MEIYSSGENLTHVPLMPVLLFHSVESSYYQKHGKREIAQRNWIPNHMSTVPHFRSHVKPNCVIIAYRRNYTEASATTKNTKITHCTQWMLACRTVRTSIIWASSLIDRTHKRKRTENWFSHKFTKRRKVNKSHRTIGYISLVLFVVTRMPPAVATHSSHTCAFRLHLPYHLTLSHIFEKKIYNPNLLFCCDEWSKRNETKWNENKNNNKINKQFDKRTNSKR